MRNIYSLFIFLSIVMLGCTPNLMEENKVIQKIDSLNMNIFSKSGDKIYSITSPNSSYNISEIRVKKANHKYF